MLKKYWTIFKTEIQRQFTYRANILAYIVGNLLSLASQVIIWYVVFQNVDIVRGYTFEAMMSYVVVGWFFVFLTTNYNIEQLIARNVHHGTITNFLLKPMSYLRFIVVQCTGRVTIAFVIAIGQSIFYFSVLHDYLLFSFSWQKAIILVLMLIFSYLIQLFYSVIVGLSAFWTTDVHGFYNLVNVIVKFFSGRYFPLNLLSGTFLSVSLFLPFAYVHFIPVQLYIDKIGIKQGLMGLGVQIFWLIILYFIIKIIWKRGLKKNESVGI